MKVRDFRRLSGWVDYDRPRLIKNKLTKGQEISYFQKRIKMVLLIPTREIYKSLLKRKKNSSTVLCFGTCICCSIEAFGKFCTGRLGRGNSGPNFRAFVNKYMNSGFSQQLNGTSYVDLLWTHFRNGLAHGFTIKKGGFEFNKDYFQIKRIDGVDQLEIDPKHFYEDFLRGYSKYVSALEASSPQDAIYANFSKVFEDVFLKGK